VEEPHFYHEHDNSLKISHPEPNISIVVPHLKDGLTEQEVFDIQQKLLADLFEEKSIKNYIFWYYTPMPLPIGEGFKPQLTVYDCMDELSNFKFAPAALRDREAELFSKADIVFTGGHNLYQAKKNCHDNIYPFPSSIDKKHFIKARKKMDDPADQAHIPFPRFGFYGVVDERFDVDLIKQVAERKPEWQFVIIGPVVKIDPDTLPRLANIHYLPGKNYKELPNYIAGWDIALIPFLLNDSTKYISPTKTPEYLAAGKPVISSSIKDVVTPYGYKGLVHIADTAEAFIKAAEIELKNKKKKEWLAKVDDFLAENSWDQTWSRMMNLITTSLNKNLNKQDRKVRDINSIQKVAYV
jgi:UDP-galactopyranose mutase